MKVLLVVHRNDGVKPEEFAALSEPGAAQARRLYAIETARELYSRTDGKGSVLILEVRDEAEGKAIADELPVIKAGLMRYELYGLKPYRAFV